MNQSRLLLLLCLLLICVCNRCCYGKMISSSSSSSSVVLLERRIKRRHQKDILLRNRNDADSHYHNRLFLLQRQQQKYHASNIIDELNNQRRRTQQIEIIDMLRGGASRHHADEKEEEEDAIELSSDAESNDNVMLSKTRNIIRSLLKILKNKSPPLYKALRAIVQKIETIFNIKLLQQKQQKSSSATKKSKSKSISTKKNKNKNANAKITNKEAKISDNDERSQEKKKKKKKQKTKSSIISSAAIKKQLAASEKGGAGSGNFRIQKELKEFIKSPPDNISINVGSNIRVWIVTLKPGKNTIYSGEIFKLRISFPKNYPIVPPSVYFLPKPAIPKHEHVYTNGDICLSLLGNGWRPNMTAQSIAISILSILSSATKKELPMDNARHSHNKPGQYQKDWVYHDDNC